MARPRTSKEIASRLDPDYFHRAGGLRLWRRILSIVAVAGSLAWWWAGGTRGHARMFSPGPVSSAHAMWNNDCAKCHDNDAKGGFRAAVSDNACLQCHAAAAHHPSQLLREGANAYNPLALAVNDPHKGLRSARCIECHVEHRGHATLGVIDNSKCTQCHRDVNIAMQPTTRPTTAQHVTAFNLSDHPHFGGGAGEAVLSFTHAKHYSRPEMKMTAGDGSCQLCHAAPFNASSLSTSATRPATMSRTDGRYLEPVFSYALSCEQCHHLTLPGVGIAVPHTDLATIRAGLLEQTADLADFYRRLYRQQAARPDKSDKPESDWIGEQREKLIAAMFEFYTDQGAQLGDAAARDAFVTAGASPPKDYWPDAKLAAIFFETRLARSRTNSGCAECHALRTSPSGQLETAPTGTRQGPRWWYTHSRFDHAAHSDMSCLNCHAKVKDDANASMQQLLPDITWTAGGKTQSCVDCHHPSNASGPGASVNCVSCHTFHARL